MWAQLINVQLEPGSDLSALADVLKAAEQPGSGLVRELFMHDQNDLHSALHPCRVRKRGEGARA